jgi:hypothetical protein
MNSKKGYQPIMESAQTVYGIEGFDGSLRALLPGDRRSSTISAIFDQRAHENCNRRCIRRRFSVLRL